MKIAEILAQIICLTQLYIIINNHYLLGLLLLLLIILWLELLWLL